MKKSTRRNFIKSVSALGAAIPLLKPNEIFGQFNDAFVFQSPFMKAVMQKDYPLLTSLWIDSLGKNKAAVNPILSGNNINAKYRTKASAKSISYWIEGQEKNDLPAWKFIFSDKNIHIISEKNNHAEPFNITVNQELDHTTVLGIMKEPGKVSLPCLIHLPDMGTFNLLVTYNLK